MKVFSADAWEDGDTHSRKQSVEKYYHIERGFIDKLMEDEEFNNCFLKHKELELTILDRAGHKRCRGKCILSRKMNSDTPCDMETFRKAEQQLAVIHKNHIYHNDVALRNILWWGDKVYFIDFSYSYPSQNKLEFLSDHYMLEVSFDLQ